MGSDDAHPGTEFLGLDEISNAGIRPLLSLRVFVNSEAIAEDQDGNENPSALHGPSPDDTFWRRYGDDSRQRRMLLMVQQPDPGAAIGCG